LDAGRRTPDASRRDHRPLRDRLALRTGKQASVIASGRTSAPGFMASTRAGWPPCIRYPLLMAARKQAA